MKFDIGTLYLEINRTCTLNCPHCEYRTDNSMTHMDIGTHTIDRLCSSISSIQKLVICGGEPSIQVDRLSYLLAQLKKNKIQLKSFYISTNGNQLSAKFISICNSYYKYTLTCQTSGMKYKIDNYPNSRYISDLLDTITNEIKPGSQVCLLYGPGIQSPTSQDILRLATIPCFTYKEVNTNDCHKCKVIHTDPSQYTIDINNLEGTMYPVLMCTVLGDLIDHYESTWYGQTMVSFGSLLLIDDCLTVHAKEFKEQLLRND